MVERLPPEFSALYRLRELLGKGGMGLVYRAVSTSNDMDVAIKFMAGELFEGDDAEARFMAEARAVEGLQHPNLVTVIDCGKAGTTPFIVFEYVAGETLKDRVRREGRLPVPDALHIAAGLLEGLKAAHSRQVIHRDIKAENVLLDRNTGRPKVADFGIAKSDRPQQTKTGVIMGTPAYMAPEQAGGTKLDARADVYSAGIVLFEMVTGQLPFGDENSMAVMMAHLNEPVPAPSYLVEGLPHLMDDLIGGALAKRPEDRYPSAGAFLIALKRTQERLEKAGYRDIAPTAAAGATRAVHLSTPRGDSELAGFVAQRSETMAGSAVTLARGAETPSSIERTLATTGPSVNSTILRPGATHPPPRRSGLLAAGAAALTVLVGLGGWYLSTSGDTPEASADEALARAEDVRKDLDRLTEPGTPSITRQGLLAGLPGAIPTEDGALAQAALGRLEDVQALLEPGSEDEQELLITRVALGDFSAYSEGIELAGGRDGERPVRALAALAQGLARGSRPPTDQVDELARELWAIEPSGVAKVARVEAFYEALGTLGGERVVDGLEERLKPGRRDDMPPATQRAVLAALQAVAAGGHEGSSRARVLLAEGAKGDGIEIERTHETLDSVFHGTQEVGGS
jgi:hypothetical protein